MTRQLDQPQANGSIPFDWPSDLLNQKTKPKHTIEIKGKENPPGEEDIFRGSRGCERKLEIKRRFLLSRLGWG